MSYVPGTKAYLHDRNSPSWLPTLNLGYNLASASQPSSTTSKRYQRLQSRPKTPVVTRRKRKRLDEQECNLGDSQQDTVDSVDSEELYAPADDSDDDRGENQGVVLELQETQENNVNMKQSASSQTHIEGSDIEKMQADLKTRVLESASLKKNNLSIYDRQCYVEDPKKVQFYTGLPSLAVMDIVFGLVEDSMSNHTLRLTKEQEFLVCLVKLRLNYQFLDMAYQLNVSEATVQRSFHRTLDVLHARLSFLLRWPEREDLRASMPMCFRESFGQKVAVIVDCFEIPTEKPSGAANQIQTYSNYKHKQTVKYLIGITPQGSVSFLSDAWGGRASDKVIIEDSGLLLHLLPGDILMADRGFRIEDECMFYQAQLAIPDFTRGKKQLHPLEVENTKRIANVRIHVERIIGLICRKFCILQSVVPIEYLRVKLGDPTPTIDKIVNVCCCLVNLHPSVVPFD